MSGLEVAGIILGAYPLIVTALDVYKASKGGKGAESFARHLKTEELIFRDFVHSLVAPGVSTMVLMRLERSNPPDLAIWKDRAIQADMRDRLGSEKAENVVRILEEIQQLLDLLQQELAPITHGVELLRRFRTRMRRLRYDLPQSSLKEHLDRLESYNIQLQRLLADHSLPSMPAYDRKTKPCRRFLRRDSRHAVAIYNAICDGYRCTCKAPHLANFSLPRISDDTRTDSGLISRSHFELLFAIDESAMSEAEPASSGDLDDLTMTWSKFSIGSEVVQSPRRISIAECDHKDHDFGQQTAIHDLCVFLKTLDPEEPASDPQVGFLKIEEKQYQLETPTKLQGSSPGKIECLDRVLVDQQFSLSRKERICLALSLSHAILSFYSTPWIETCWSWGDFCIDRENNGQLFATRKFYSSQMSTLASASRESLTSTLWAIHGEPTLTRLGFALIELALGKRLAELRSDNQYPGSDPDTLDFLTAKTLVESGCVMQAEGQKYENAVKACLLHQFLRSSELVGLDSKRPNFQVNVEESILAPLHTIVAGSWGIQ